MESSVAGSEAEKALNHLIIARRESVDPSELERINAAITATHRVVEDAELPDASPQEAKVDAATLLRLVLGVSDRERGELLELSAPAAGVSGRIVNDVDTKLQGFDPEVRAAAFMLAILGIADHALPYA